MKKTPKIIIGAGFGSSGLSAFINLLDEIDGFYTTPQEFAMFNDPDGIISLESAIIDNWSIFQGNVALRRFKKFANVLSKKYVSPYPNLDYSLFFGSDFKKAVNKYVDNLTNITFMGMSYGVDTLISRQLNQRFPIFRRSSLTNDKMYVAKNLNEKEFLEYTRIFINDLAEICLKKYNKSSFVFDEGFVSLSLNKVLRYLPEDSKVVVVIRDPRDVYAELRASNDAWMFQPNKINDFIEYQRAMFTRWEEQKIICDPKRFIELKFDDLILNYEESVSNIFKFLSISPESHIKPKTKLKPEISIKNVGRWKKNLNNDEILLFNSKLNGILKKYNWI